MNQKKSQGTQELYEMLRQDQRQPTTRNISIHVSDHSHYNVTFNIYNCGNQDQNVTYGGKPDHYLLYFVNEGRGSVIIRQVVHKVEAGHGFVMFPGEEILVKPHYKEGMNVTWVAFSGYLVDRYLSRANLTIFEPVFVDNAEHEVEQMFEALLLAANRFPNRYCKMMAQLYSIFGFLLDNIVRETKPNATTPEFYLMRTLDFIDMNYHDSISIDDIAASMDLSRKALTTIFATLTGSSPKDYLIYYRITKAIDLLRNPNLSLEMIATAVGYNDQFYFSKQFKKKVGMTPSLCRRKLAEDPGWRYESPLDTVRQQYASPLSAELPPKF